MRHGSTVAPVLAFKFLDREGCTALSGHRWTLPDGDAPGPWIETARVRPCREGIHACHAGDLAYWLHQELWVIELDGETTESARKVVARRGRLVRRLPEWSAGADVALHEWCAWRTCDTAVGLLNEQGEGAWAARLREATTLRDLAAGGQAAAAALGDGDRAGVAAGYAGDAAALSGAEHFAASPFVAACAKGHAASTEGGEAGEAREGAYAAAFAAERASQSAWIRDRLEL